MHDAVVTFVTRDHDQVITKVYRLEFESEEEFKKWLYNDMYILQEQSKVWLEDIDAEEIKIVNFEQLSG